MWSEGNRKWFYLRRWVSESICSILSGKAFCW